MQQGKKLKRLNDLLTHERKKRGWSQARLAEILDVEPSMISRWEKGERAPASEYQEQLCKIFEKNAVELGFLSSEIASPLPPAIYSPSLAKDDFSSHTPQDSSITNNISVATLDLALPLPPQPYFAHPYPLQENFTGRIHERKMLTEWLIKDQHSVLALTALGGMGKSSLAWTWLQQDVLNFSKAVRPYGVVWWSFYEAEAYFATFLNQALTYTSHKTINPGNISSIYEKMQALINLLQNNRFLLILDGFERQLRAYDGLLDTQHSNLDLEETSGNFRICVDPHVGSFLRWLASGTINSKVLLTSRLFPYELEGIAGCRQEKLKALNSEDAISFLHAQGVKGTRAELHTACTFYGNHPLTLRLLAGAVVYDPEQPGDIAVATEYNILPEIVQREHHVLSFAYNALSLPLQQLLSNIATSRSVLDFAILKVINPLADERELKGALRELVDRGFLFFDRERGLYDLHPLVRQYAYNRLQRKEKVHATLADYFHSIMNINLTDIPIDRPRKIRTLLTEATPEGLQQIKSVEEIAPTIEFFHHLILANELEKAFRLFYLHLASLLYHQLGAYHTVIELLQDFFLDGEILRSDIDSSRQSWVLDALANAYSASGDPGRAVQLLKASIQIDQERNDRESLAAAKWNLAVQQLMLGELAAAEQNLQECISLCKSINDVFNEAKSHQYLALLRAYQGMFDAYAPQLDVALALFEECSSSASESTVWAYRALCSLIAEDFSSALTSVQTARKLAVNHRYERDVIRAHWLLGLIKIHLSLREGNKNPQLLSEAETHLKEAIERCRRIDMVDYEADLLLAWARLHFARGRISQAKADAMEALAIADRSAFRVLRADIHTLIARLYLEENKPIEALSSAEKALQDALCDGPPYCYAPTLQQAELLQEKAKQLL